MPAKIVLEKDEVLSVLPHRGKMVLLHRVTACDIESRSLCGEYTVAEDGIFFDAALGGMPAWAAFECMAQAACAFAGITDRGGVKSGLLLSVAKMEIRAPLLAAGTVLRLHVTEDCRLGDAVTFDAAAFTDSGEVASAKITILETESFTGLAETKITERKTDEQ